LILGYEHRNAIYYQQQQEIEKKYKITEENKIEVVSRMNSLEEEHTKLFATGAEILEKSRDCFERLSLEIKTYDRHQFCVCI
jgi:hypothetical protein